MPLDLEGPSTKAQLDEVAHAKPETRIGAHVSGVDGGTVTAAATSEGSWWSLTAWAKWARRGGKSAGADVEVKF